MSSENRIAELEAQVRYLMSAMVSHSEEQRSMIYKDNTFDSGDTAWMLASTALVLFMTIPGLALYYGGMVRKENVLATVMQIFTITCLITAFWLFFGYSLSFAPADPSSSGGNMIFGDGSRIWLQGMTINSVNQMAPNIPEALFCAYQLTFAIITPCLIVGAFADRMKYIPMIIFMACWHLVVYCPVAHSIWHPNGFLKKENVLDFAGGNVVHISSGVSGLISSIVIGKRIGYDEHRFEPHNILYTAVGVCMLWVGWYGFNAGSAVAANQMASYALINTQIATSISAFSWMIVESFFRGKPSVLGMVNGAVAGLVCITPACGYVAPTGSFFIGLIGGVVCYFGAQIKRYFGYDDALDAFGVHAIGGITGGILTGFFATASIGGTDGVLYTSSVHDGGHVLAMQLYAIVVTIGWSAFASYVILQIIDLTMGIRVSAEDEQKGLDDSQFKESVGNDKLSWGQMSISEMADPNEKRKPKKTATIPNVNATDYESVPSSNGDGQNKTLELSVTTGDQGHESTSGSKEEI